MPPHVGEVVCRRDFFLFSQLFNLLQHRPQPTHIHRALRTRILRTNRLRVCVLGFTSKFFPLRRVMPEPLNFADMGFHLELSREHLDIQTVDLEV